MRLHILYATRFAYAHAVRESVNELRAAPVSDHRQTLVDYRVTTTPSARIHSSADYWGTRLDAFGIREPHTALEVVAEATVETRWSRPPMASAPLHRNVGTTVAYAPGSTYVGVEVVEVLRTRQGVCQDFAHLLIALCRSAGVPARYVSGYFFAVDDSTGEAGDADVVHVQTHAWVEVAIPGIGWWALDPTNRQEVGERHVKIGHGRDYDDVPPLKGVFSGPQAHELEAIVEMRRSQAQAAQQ